MNKLKSVGIIIFLSFIATGCATIAHGTSTKISVKTDPSGALATVGNKSITTPGELVVKNNKPETLVITKSGYKSMNIYFEQAMSGWVWGNILVGGIIGVGIDYISGGAYRLAPNNVNVTLEQAN